MKITAKLTRARDGKVIIMHREKDFVMEELLRRVRRRWEEKERRGWGMQSGKMEVGIDVKVCRW